MRILIRYCTDCRQHAAQVLNAILQRVFRKQRSLSPKICVIQIKIESQKTGNPCNLRNLWLEITSET